MLRTNTYGPYDTDGDIYDDDGAVCVFWCGGELLERKHLKSRFYAHLSYITRTSPLKTRSLDHCCCWEKEGNYCLINEINFDDLRFATFFLRFEAFSKKRTCLCVSF